MSEEILVNVTPPETRVAVVENGVVQELIIERASRRGLVGNIYKGTICRVLPGMQAAFVDIGLQRAAFLHASDINSTNGPESNNISDLVREGHEIVVQVVKDPLGTKGARLTTTLSIPSRYLVFMPSLESTGISQKIEDEEERQRLRDIIEEHTEDLPANGSFIARTVAEGVDEATLRSDIRFLSRLWHNIQDRRQSTPSGQLIHEDLPLYLRALRDLVTPNVEKIRIDSRESWQKLTSFAERVIPDSQVNIEYYPGERPILIFMVSRTRSKKLLREKSL